MAKVAVALETCMEGEGLNKLGRHGRVRSSRGYASGNILNHAESKNYEPEEGFRAPGKEGLK